MDEYGELIEQVGDLRSMVEEQERYILFGDMINGISKTYNHLPQIFNDFSSRAKEGGKVFPTNALDYIVSDMQESLSIFQDETMRSLFGEMLPVMQEIINSQSEKITSYESKGKPIVADIKPSETLGIYSIDVMCKYVLAGQVVSNALIGEVRKNFGQFEVRDPEGYDNKGVLRFAGPRRENYGFFQSDNAPLAVEALEKLLSDDNYKTAIGVK